MPQTLKCHILKIRLRQHKAEKGICQFLMTSEGLTVTIQKEDAFPSLVFFFSQQRSQMRISGLLTSQSVECKRNLIQIQIRGNGNDFLLP